MGMNQKIPPDPVVYAAWEETRTRRRPGGSKNRAATVLKARGFQCSHTHVSNVLQRYNPRDEHTLEYEPCPGEKAWVPVSYHADAALLQHLILETTPATPLKTDYVASVQVATPGRVVCTPLNANAPAVLMLKTCNAAYVLFGVSLLQSFTLFLQWWVAGVGMMLVALWVGHVMWEAGDACRRIDDHERC